MKEENDLKRWRIDYNLPMTDGDGGTVHTIGLHPMTVFCSTEADAHGYSLPLDARDVRVSKLTDE